MQNVLFFIFRMYGGGAERTVSNLSQAFADRYNIKIATYDQEERTYPYAGELIRIKLPFSKDVAKNGMLPRALRLLVLIFKLRQLKKRYAIDVCISFSEQANIINLLTKRNRTIISVRTTLSEEIKSMPRMKVLRGFVRLLYNRAHCIITPSLGIYEDLIANFNIQPGKIQVIPNYIDREKISRLSHIPLPDLFLTSLFQQDVLLHVGRITAAKGLWLAFHIYRTLKPLYPRIKLVSIGEGESEAPFKMRILDYARTLGLKVFDRESNDQEQTDSDIFFLGFQSNPFQFMKSSRLLIFPSVFEGFPNTILEAMECGLPVVAADCNSGPRFILAPDSTLTNHTEKFELAKFGILVPPLVNAEMNTVIAPAIVEEWTEAVGLLLTENNLRNKYIAAGPERVKDFDKKRILNQWELLLSGE
ncbi:MAG: glycosyltransferase [Chitinophagaceae bacterium]|nr:glycosyltransferase [Chitinophagaceae bacterium]